MAGEINRRMPEYVVNKAAEALNEDRKPINGSSVLVIGLAYKPNVDDTRETPAAPIIELLAQRGAIVSYHDPHVPKFPQMRNYAFDMKSVDLTKQVLDDADCVLIVTDHASIDWDFIGANAGLVVDTRNAMADVECSAARVMKA